MIDPAKARPGLHCFYQRPEMRSPEYGIITTIGPQYIHVRFDMDQHAKACLPIELYWPPDYCALHDADPPGQTYSKPEEMPNA